MAAAAHRGPLPDWFESRSFTLSLMLHLVLVLVAAFGLPFILPKKPEPVPMVMTVEVLPIAAMTNVKPSQEPITEKKEAPTPVKQPSPAPQKAEPPKPKVVEKVEPEEKPFDPTEGAEKKPEPKKEVAKEEPKKQEDDFLKTLNNLKAEAEKTNKKAKDTAATEENKTRSDAPYDASLPLSLSEQDAIRNQFIPCWSPPMGAKDAANLVVILKAQYKQDGTLIDVKLRADQQGRYGSDAFFRAAADAAMRAVHRCELKNLDQGKYGAWRDMELTFDPKAYF
jgi:type IV secretory pathway VirB10-like protein